MSPLLVVLPTCLRDAPLMRKNLEWQVELGGCKEYDAVLALDREMPDSVSQPLLALAKSAYHFVRRFDYPTPKVPQWPYGPNWAFQQTATFMHSLRSPWLWLEADAIPLRKDWLKLLSNEYLHAQRPFMGVIVPGYGHCNGVAIYPHNACRMMPRAMLATEQAWDTVMRPEMIALCHNAPNLIQHAWGRINGVFDPHVGEAPSFPPGRGLEEINPKAAILHRNKDGTLIDRMREGTVKRAVAPTGGPRMAIFIRTFKNDAQWLVYCLRSIKKFCTGYSEVVLACPKEDMAVIQQVVAPYRHRVVPVENDPAKGYLEQQVTKLCADQFTDAEYILMTDSDCLFIVPNTPLSWFTNGRIVHLITPWAALEGGGAMVWRKPTEAALGYPCEYETMRRHPFVFPRSVIANCRKWIENRHRKPIREYVLSTGGFSEFNSLASYAMSREPQWFTFVNTTNNPLPPEIVKQFWSWGGITPEVKQRMDAILV